MTSPMNPRPAPTKAPTGMVIATQPVLERRPAVVDEHAHFVEHLGDTLGAEVEGSEHREHLRVAQGLGVQRGLVIVLSHHAEGDRATSVNHIHPACCCLWAEFRDTYVCPSSSA